MAFNESPIVDRNSERSEESVLNVKSIFTRKAGFISRDEIPDYGVDLNVELVVDQNATSNVFPVQIKSAREIKIITHSNQTFISVDFLTSRLGYLCRRPPSYGIVVVYDEATQVSYFDFVEDIVQRLNEHKGNDEWKDQETVRIRILKTILDASGAVLIHTKMTSRFSSNQLLISAFGELYRIPTLGAKSDDFADFNDPKQIESVLMNHGLDLFNSKAYDMIIDLLSRLSQRKITQSKELSLLAAITYGQTGMIIECDYYLGKCGLDPRGYNDDDTFLLNYTKIMQNFRKGNFKVDQFKDEVRLLKAKSKNPLNVLTLDINLIYAEFLQSGKEPVDRSLLHAIKEVSERIEQSELPVSDKALLKLFNLENLHNYGTGLLLSDGGKFKIQQKLGLHVSMQERLMRVKEIVQVTGAATDGVHKILKDSMESEDKIVSAFGSYYKARFFFSMQFQIMMLGADEPRSSTDHPALVYENTLDFCYQSISLFYELSLFHEVHLALCCAYDLQMLYRVMYKAGIGKRSLDEIEKNLREVENATGIRPHQSIVASTFEKLTSSKEFHDGSWSTVPDDQIERFAKIVLDGYSIPQDRLANIIVEINVLNTFSRECTNPDLQLLFDLGHLRSPKTTYATLPVFFIRSKKSGIESRKSSNITELLDQYSGILKKQ